MLNAPNTRAFCHFSNFRPGMYVEPDLEPGPPDEELEEHHDREFQLEAGDDGAAVMNALRGERSVGGCG